MVYYIYRSKDFQTLRQSCLNYIEDSNNTDDETYTYSSTYSGTPLCIAIVSQAPEIVIRALLSICPEAAAITDPKSKCIPLHLACSMPTTLISKISKEKGEQQIENLNLAVVKCLLRAFPAGIYAQDANGRSPLHYLLLFHTETRTTDVIEEVSGRGSEGKERVIEKLDGYGRLPLHYAAINRATKDVLDFLVSEFPNGVEAQDNLEKDTPLSLYLKVAKKRESAGKVSKLSTTVISMLLNRRVASLVDIHQRSALHLAAEASRNISEKAVRNILETNINSLTLKDYRGMTPLHTLVSNGNAPPKSIQSMLLENTIDEFQEYWNAAKVEDDAGNLVLHCVCELSAFSDPNQLAELISANPMSIVTTNSEGRSPLHLVFINEENSSSVSVSSVLPLLAGYEEFDGQCVLKLEDELSNLPIHYAARHGAPPEVLAMLVETYPLSACALNSDGDLPIHLVYNRLQGKHTPSKDLLDVIEMLLKLIAKNFSACDSPGSIGIKYPIHIASSFPGFSPNIFEALLSAYPMSAKLKDGNDLYPIELLQSLKGEIIWKDSFDFYKCREELFARFPDIMPFRKEKQLLDSFIIRIRREATSDNELTSASKLIWIWLCTYTNLSDQSDHYSEVVRNILNGLSRKVSNRLLSVKTESGSSVQEEASSEITCILSAQLYFMGKYVFQATHPIHTSSNSLIVAADMFDLKMKSYSNKGGTIKSPVIIKFMANLDDYNREVNHRSAVSNVSSILGIIEHFSVIGERSSDIRFKSDINDEVLIKPLCCEEVQKYCHAIVLYHGNNDLFDRICHSELESTEIHHCLKDIGEGLRLLHENGKKDTSEILIKIIVTYKFFYRNNPRRRESTEYNTSK